jgi:dihydrofolate synthase/folylpolyglutamate synthase
MKIYSYEEVLEKMNHAGTFGSRPGVENSKILLDALNHPEQGIPFVHVAGTNGKGSVCAFFTRILMESGFKVGTFTSPHLIRFEERITVNNVQISREDVTRLGNRLLALTTDATPTMFDFCMSMAILYFQEQKCDIMVMETGLGGRLDSTNAIGTPEVSVITKIGFDHMAILGDTLAKIASEKAGIIKPGTFLVLERQEPEAAEVLQNVIEQTGGLTCVRVTEEDLARAREQKLGLLGTHQWENAAAATLAAEHLLKKYRPDWSSRQTEQAIAAGLAHTYWPGRMEILSEKPFFMADGAHNGHGVQALFDSLSSLYPGEKFHFIMGVMADKDYGQMVKCLLPLALDFKTVTPENARALQAGELASFIGQYGVSVKTYDKILDVVTDILHAPQHNEKIIAFGSLYFIGELKGEWKKQYEEYHSNL